MSFLGKVKRKVKKIISGDNANKQTTLTKAAASPEERITMTIGEIASRLDCDIPEELEYLRDENVSDVVLSYINSIKGSAILTPTNYEEVLLKNFNYSMPIGPKVIFCDRKTYEETDKTLIENHDTPFILLDNARQQIYNFVKPYRDAYHGKVITVTGSFGKTTTKFLVESILKDKPAFSNKANNNSIHSVAENIMKNMKPEYEYFVQETGAVRVGTIETAASYLRPDISIVTNVRPHHLAAYGSLENVFNDKMQIVKQINEGGTAIVNFDDELIAAYDYKCNVASFGIETDKDVVYRGKNIVQNAGVLEMDVDYPGGTVHLASNLVGKYNAYNMLAGFAFGKVIGLDDSEIAESMSKGKLGGTRQNLLKYGSNTFFVDCYNVANETILNSMDVLMDLEPEEGGRRIAIVGGENSLTGDERTQKTIELGKALAKYKVDEIVCFGDGREEDDVLKRYGDARTLYKTLLENGYTNTRIIFTKEDMADYLAKEVHKGDVVLFKCITYLDVTIPIDKVFGTNFCMTSTRVKKRMVEGTENGFSGQLIWAMDEAVITGSDGNVPENLVIPDRFMDQDVYGIGTRAFYQKKIKTLDLGNKVKVIMPGAFKNCEKLTSVRIPDSLMHVMRGGFRGCEKLQEVTFGKGIREIEVNAFDGCKSLRKVVIPAEADVRIEKGAFPENTEISRV